MEPKFARHALAQNAEPAKVRFEKLDGIDHLVAPAILVQEQVLHCSNCFAGGEFISAEEIALSQPGWNGTPVTINHPTRRGEMVSVAATPEVFAEENVGVVLNTRVVGNQLHGELWLNTILMQRSEERRDLMARLRAGTEIINVSTGFFRLIKAEAGMHGGEKYAFVQHRVMPDHLAILPKQKGACSVQHGCGTPRTNEEGTEGINKRDEGIALSSDEVGTIRSFFRTLKTLISGNSDGGKKDPAANADGSSATGPTSAGGVMDPKEKARLITELAANTAVPFDQKALEAMSDDALKFLAESTKAKETPPPTDGVKPTGNAGGCGDGAAAAAGKDPAGKTEPGKTNDQGKAPATLSAEDQSLLAWAKESKPQIEALLANAKAEQAAREQERTDIITRLVANERCGLSEKALKSMNLETLQELEEEYREVSYGGRATPSANRGKKDDDGIIPPPPPVVLSTTPLNQPEQKKAPAGSGKED